MQIMLKKRQIKLFGDFEYQIVFLKLYINKRQKEQQKYYYLNKMIQSVS